MKTSIIYIEGKRVTIEEAKQKSFGLVACYVLSELGAGIPQRISAHDLPYHWLNNKSLGPVFTSGKRYSHRPLKEA